MAQLVKNLSAGDLGSIPGLGRSPGERNGYPRQYSCLENATDRCRRDRVTNTSRFHVYVKAWLNGRVIDEQCMVGLWWPGDIQGAPPGLVHRMCFLVYAYSLPSLNI